MSKVGESLKLFFFAVVVAVKGEEWWDEDEDEGTRRGKRKVGEEKTGK